MYMYKLVKPTCIPLLGACRYALAKENELAVEPRVALTVTPFHKLSGVVLSLEKCWADTLTCSLHVASSLVRSLQVTPTHGTRTALGGKCRSRMLPDNEVVWQHSRMFQCACACPLCLFVPNILCWLHSGNPLVCVEQMAHIPSPAPQRLFPFSRVGMQSISRTSLNYWTFCS